MEKFQGEPVLAARPEKPADKKDIQSKKEALLFGIVFELGLITLSILGSADGWLSTELRNFVLIVHMPPFMMMEGSGGDSIISITLAVLVLLAYEVFLVLVWSSLFSLARKAIQNLGISIHLKWLIGVAVAIIAMTALGWELADAHYDHPTPYTPSANLKTLVSDNNAFALDLYQQLKAQPDNLFFSPFSISSGMGMIYAGARGRSETELAKALHFDLAQTNLHPAFADLGSRFKNVQHWNHLALLTANSLWYQQEHPLSADYEKLLAQDYNADARAADFKNSHESVRRQMSGWIEEKTRGRLKGSIPQQALAPDTELVLINTVYFKGKWAHQFKRSQTKPAPFYITEDQPVIVPMMNQHAEFKTAQVELGDEGFLQMLEMPYYGRDLSMVILLPLEKDGLPKLEPLLNAQNLNRWLAELDRSRLDSAYVHVPRFTFTKTLDLKSELKRLGVNSIFFESNADLSGMDGSTNLFVSEILHQAFVDLNEEGTEAAAMTFSMAKSKSASGRFIADHPFIFLIRDNATGSILFLGRMLDPRNS